MPLEQYVTQVQIQLAAAAALGDDRTRATAETLATAAGPAIRLALMAAATSLADEITAVLQDAPGAPAVSVRLDGGDLGIEVRMSDAGEAAAEAATASPEDGENAARISLRLPD